MSEWETIAPAEPATAAGGAPGMNAAPSAQEWEPVFEQAPASALNSIDRKTGGPNALRLAVAQAETPEDQLAVVRQQYPDARWIEFGEQPGERLSRQTGTTYQQKGTPERHLVFTNPETGQPTTLNPAGLDLGDVAQLGPEVARGGAYVAGAAASQLIPGLQGNPVAMAAGGTLASQATKYLTEPVVEWLTGFNIPDTRPMGERLMAGGADALTELTGSFAGEATGMALRKVTRIPYAQEKKALMRSVPRGQGRPEVVRALEGMADEQGIFRDKALRGALPLATKGDTVRGFFQAASKYPRATETINDALEETYGVIRRDFERIQRGVGAGAKEKGTAGQTLQWGLKKYATDTSKRQELLEGKLVEAVGAKTRTPMARTQELIAQELGKIPPGTKPGGGIVPGDYLDLAKTIEANGGELPFDYVRAFRESIGEGTSGGLIAPTGAKTKWYDPLYGALTEDMKAAAEQGGPAALKAFTATQTNWAQRETRLELLRQVANAKHSELAFRSAIAGAEDGPSLLTALKASVPKDAWDDLVSVKLWDMSTTAKGVDAGDEVGKVFSPTRFVGNYGNMSDASKDVLFGTSGSSPLRKQLDRLATVTAASREFKGSGAGRIGASGTPQGNVYMEMLGEGGMSEVMTGGKVGMAKALGRALNPWNRARRANRQALLMTDPDFVRWLADGTDIPPKPTAVGAHLRRLSGGAFAAKPPALRNALAEYLEEWRGTTAQVEDEPQGQ